MAISLSNHEDRIKALENKSLQLSNIKVDKLWTGDITNNTKLSIPNLNNYNIVWIKVNFYYIGCYVCIRGTKNGIGDDIGDGHKTQAWITLNNDNTLSYEVTIWDYSSRRLLEVWGLKLYYNFSYNIYRLANFILFHFFKCLINSFKGGVKEIWQLV